MNTDIQIINSKLNILPDKEIELTQINSKLKLNLKKLEDKCEYLRIDIKQYEIKILNCNKDTNF